MSYFRFWPIFSICGFSSTGSQRVQGDGRLELRLAGGSADGDVIRFARLPGKRIADDLRPPRQDRRGLRIDTESLLRGHLGD